MIANKPIYAFKMGIQKFSDFLKKHAPNCCFEISLESLRGKTIAIDMHGLIYQMLSGATNIVVSKTNVVFNKPNSDQIERTALDMILNKLEILMYYGILPVCVFDGKSHALKSQTQVKRKADREKAKQKLLIAEQALYSVDPFSRTSTLVEEYKKCFRASVESRWDFSSQLKEILGSTGFPVLSADDFPLDSGDAEGLCASLCLQGNDYCFATISEDSDYHVYGGNLEILEIYTKSVDGSTEHFAKIRSLESILKQSGLYFEQFQDLCIMMGTDYNPNIPGIGPVKSFDKLRQYGNLDNISQVLDTTRLGYHEVRKIFNSAITKIEITQPTFDVTKFKMFSRDLFDRYELKSHTDIILKMLPGIHSTELELESKVDINPQCIEL
jgi:flap endonuclease-1